MQRVYIAATLIDAYLIADMLASLGIATRILNSHAAGALGELPFTQAQPEVWVDDDMYAARACEALAHLGDAPAKTEKYCPYCGEINPGNFLSCWQCQTALPPE